MDINEILEPHVLDEGQEKLLKLLKKFDSRCREYGITYYLGGGTALGAIRHRGFLPWDDDVDLYISRDNYLKLLAVKDSFFDDKFVLVAHETYNTYGNVLVRLVDTDSTAITKARIADDAPKGQFLELFIMDPMPQNEDEKNVWLVKHWIYAEILAFAFKVANERIIEYLDFDLYEKYKNRCEKEGTESVLEELKTELFSIEESNATEYCSRWGLRNLIYDIDWFGEPRYVPFEDTYLPVPCRAERVLRFDYGDSWMIIPKASKRTVHSIATDMNVSYSYYLDGFREQLDFQKVLDAYPERKDAFLKSFRATCSTNKLMQELQRALVELEANRIDVSGIKEKLNNKNFDGILEEMNFWYRAQSGKYFWPVREYLNIGDELLKVTLTALLVNNNYSNVLKIVEWRKKNGEKIPKDIQEIEFFANVIRDAYIALEENNMILLRELVIQLNKEPLFEDQFDYKYLSAVYNTFNGSFEELDDTEKEIEELLADSPDNGNLIALQAEIEERRGNNNTAISYYVEAFDKTRNGLVKLRIVDALRRMRLYEEEKI